MAQATESNTTSRRSFLAGAAAALVIPTAASADADPVFAAIANHRVAYAEMERAVGAISGNKGRAPKNLRDVVEAVHEKERGALEELVVTIPTTMSGVMAILAFRSEMYELEPEALSDGHLHDLCETVEIALALQRLA